MSPKILEEVSFSSNFSYTRLSRRALFVEELGNFPGLDPFGNRSESFREGS